MMQSYHPPNTNKQWISTKNQGIFWAPQSLNKKSKPSPALAKLGTPGISMHILRVKEKVLCGEGKISHLLTPYSVFLYNADVRRVSASGLMSVI